ncbi:MAG: PKD domain-containing protein [Gemmatimonadota bacterium]|nr:PKD domain-containing protein [Gemmatimonadota bacterium]
MKHAWNNLSLPFRGASLTAAGVGLALGLSAAACSDEQVVNASVNDPPTAVIAADLTEIPEGDANATIVTISGTGSSDPDGNVLTYFWTISGGTFETGTNNSDPTIKVSFPGTAVELVTLTVRDPEGLSDFAELSIGLRPGPNSPPVAEFSVSPGLLPFGDGNTTVFTLDASGSLDPDGDPITFSWTVPGATFVGGTDSNSEVAQITLPGTSSVVVTLVVSDDGGLTDSGTFTIQLI